VLPQIEILDDLSVQQVDVVGAVGERALRGRRIAYVPQSLSAVPEMRLDWLDDVLRERAGRPCAAGLVS
jgi:hypothetical protein